MHYPQQGNPPQQQQYHASTTQQTVVIQPTLTSNGPTKYRLSEKTVLVHGAMHIVIGLLSIIFNIVLICIMGLSEYFQYNGSSAQGGAGFWCGIFFLLSGSFGIVASKHKTACPIITYMILCIISSIFGVIIFGFGCAFVAEGQQDGYSYWGLFNYSQDAVGRTYIALGSLVLIMGITELVISIWSSALCCAAVCCCRDTNGVVHNTNPIVHQNPNHQVVYINANNPAGIVYPTQAGGMYYPQGQTTYIQNQGGVPVHMAAPATQPMAPPPAQPVQPPSYSHETSPPPAYNPDQYMAPQASSGAPSMGQNPYSTKSDMPNINN